MVRKDCGALVMFCIALHCIATFCVCRTMSIVGLSVRCFVVPDWRASCCSVWRHVVSGLGWWRCWDSAIDWRHLPHFPSHSDRPDSRRMSSSCTRNHHCYVNIRINVDFVSTSLHSQLFRSVCVCHRNFDTQTNKMAAHLGPSTKIWKYTAVLHIGKCCTLMDIVKKSMSSDGLGVYESKAYESWITTTINVSTNVVTHACAA